MELFETMLKRRSIRKYTEEKISQEKLNKILQAGLLAPSSRNLKSCELIVVSDKKILSQLSKAKSAGGAMLENADKAIVVIGDAKKSDVWIEDCSITLTYMHLMATNLGIGSCWVQCRLRNNKENSAHEYISELLGIPENYEVLAILSLGIPNETRESMNIENLDFNKIHEDRF